MRTTSTRPPPTSTIPNCTRDSAPLVRVRRSRFRRLGSGVGARRSRRRSRGARFRARRPRRRGTARVTEARPGVATARRRVRDRAVPRGGPAAGRCARPGARCARPWAWCARPGLSPPTAASARSMRPAGAQPLTRHRSRASWTRCACSQPGSATTRGSRCSRCGPAGHAVRRTTGSTAALIEAGARRNVADPRLSTTYTGDGAPARAGVELWVSEPGEDPEVAGEREAARAPAPTRRRSRRPARRIRRSGTRARRAAVPLAQPGPRRRRGVPARAARHEPRRGDHQRLRRRAHLAAARLVRRVPELVGDLARAARDRDGGDRRARRRQPAVRARDRADVRGALPADAGRTADEPARAASRAARVRRAVLRQPPPQRADDRVHAQSCAGGATGWRSARTMSASGSRCGARSSRSTRSSTSSSTRRSSARASPSRGSTRSRSSDSGSQRRRRC